MLDGHVTYSAHTCGRQKDACQHYNEGDGSARCKQTLRPESCDLFCAINRFEKVLIFA